MLSFSPWNSRWLTLASPAAGFWSKRLINWATTGLRKVWRCGYTFLALLSLGAKDVTSELEAFLPNPMGVGLLISLISLIVCLKAGLSDLELLSVSGEKRRLRPFILVMLC